MVEVMPACVWYGLASDGEERDCSALHAGQREADSWRLLDLHRPRGLIADHTMRLQGGSNQACWPACASC